MRTDSPPASSPDRQHGSPDPHRAPPQTTASPDLPRPAARWKTVLAALLLGGVHTLAFAPTPHGGWLQLPVLAALYWLVSRASGRRAAWLTGFAFGVGNFTTGVYWLYVSMHEYGGMPAPLAAAAVVLFALYLGIYPGLATGAWFAAAQKLALRRRPSDWSSPVDAARPMVSSNPGTASRRYPQSLLLRPSLTLLSSFPTSLLSAAVFGGTWAIGEWLRGTVFTGFPWLSAGYAQVDGPLAGFASLVGVYGVGFAAAMAGALLAQCLYSAVNRQRQRRNGIFAGIALVLLLGAGMTAGAWRFTHATQAPLSVRLLQGNVPQDIKFEQAGLDHSIALYQRLITEKAADLVVTPETALPILINDTPEAFAHATRTFADTTGTAVLLGAAGTVERHGSIGYTNSTFGLTPGRHDLYRYDKHHLVPFGEFVPWGFRWFVDLMHIPLGDFARGPVVQTPFEVKGERFAVNICYEDLFGEEIAQSLHEQAHPASVLVNSTNLAWFGDTIALDQHLQISRMRSLEMQRPVLRATNTGTTAAIDAHGHVEARLPTFTVGSLDVRVQGMSGQTPYIRFGNAPVLIVSLLLLGLALWGGFARMHRQAGR